MSNRVEELTQSIKALAEVQRNGKTIVNTELQALIKALLEELQLKH